MLSLKRLCTETLNKTPKNCEQDPEGLCTKTVTKTLEESEEDIKRRMNTKTMNTISKDFDYDSKKALNKDREQDSRKL